MDGEAVGTKEGISLNIAPIHAHKCQRLDKILKDLLKKKISMLSVFTAWLALSLIQKCAIVLHWAIDTIKADVSVFFF